MIFRGSPALSALIPKPIQSKIGAQFTLLCQYIPSLGCAILGAYHVS